MVSIYEESKDNRGNLTPSTKYLHYDSLHSVDTITNNLGQVEARMAYEPFGKKLELDKNGNPTSKVPHTNRGYTGHEHIEEDSNFIHMNARVYDSELGRFLSADTMIPYMHNTQSFNRYSYVRNNPLKYTDPSGHYSWSDFKKDVGKHWKTVATIAVVAAVTFATGGFGGFALAGYMGLSGTAASIVACAVAGAGAGFVGGVVATKLYGGSWNQAFNNGLKGAAVGAVSGGVAGGIGGYFGHSSSFFNPGEGGYTTAGLKALAHGTSRALIAKAQGQSMSGGFWSGFASSGFSVGTEDYGGFTGRTTIMAIVGGTVSEMTGGKFANGAVSGAFVHMFNAESENIWKNYRDADKVAFGNREPSTSIGRIADRAAKGAVVGGFTMYQETKSPASIPVGMMGGAIAGGLTQAAAEASLQIDSIDRWGAVKVIIEKNK